MYTSFSDIPAGGHVHFIGIGGVSMSALAAILLSRGYAVSGSDSSSSSYTRRLSDEGAVIYLGHDAKNAEGADLIVYSAAIHPDNPERVYADEHQILSFERSVLLGEIEKLYRFPVDIAGTHGKTSTTGMLFHIFSAAQKDPTVLIGGELPSLGGNMRIGKSDYFLSESCEYHRSFLQFHPYIAILLNVEADHLDYYKDLDDIKSAFSDFAALASFAAVVNADDANALSCAASSRRVVTTSRRTAADYYADAITIEDAGCYAFDVHHDGEVLCRVSLSVPGIHHVSNALCAFAAAHLLGIAPEAIAEGLSSFGGVKRRFELKGEKNGVRVYDDYAHHPTEIGALLSAMSAYKAENRYVIFQPHTYTRTKTLYDDFVSVLSKADNLLITDIYAAREKDTGLVSSRELAASIPGALYAGTPDNAARLLSERVCPGDLVVTVGAGDIYKAGEILLTLLPKGEHHD